MLLKGKRLDHEGLMKIDILRLEAVFFPALEK